MASGPVDFLVMVDKDAVVQDSYISGLFEFAGFEHGSVEDNIIRLPLAGLTAGVYHRRSLAVNGCGLAIGIKFFGV